MSGHREKTSASQAAEASRKKPRSAGLQTEGDSVPGFELPVVLCYCSRGPLMLTLRTCIPVSTWATPELQGKTPHASCTFFLTPCTERALGGKGSLLSSWCCSVSGRHSGQLPQSCTISLAQPSKSPKTRKKGTWKPPPAAICSHPSVTSVTPLRSNVGAETIRPHRANHLLPQLPGKAGMGSALR